MNILVISNLFPPHFLGGYEILCAQVCQALRRSGHTVTALTSDHGMASPQEQAEPYGPEEIPVYRRLQLYLAFDRPPRLSRRRRWTTSRSNARVTRALIGQIRPDIVFVWSQLRLTLGAAVAAETSGVPVVYTLNDEYLIGYLPVPFTWGVRSLAGYVVDRWIGRSITLKTLHFRHVTCISQRLKDNLLHRKIPVQTARVIYQAIPVEQFPVKADPGGVRNPVHLLFVGQLHPDKGAQTLIAAAGAIAGQHGPDVLRVSIVGDGPFLSALEQQAARSGAVITFYGRIPHDQVPGMYREHDIFVFPSIWQEPFGLTPLEAMASGTPVISTVNGGQSEYIVHGVNALTFEEGNAGELADRILTLMADAPLRRRLTATARQIVEERFSFDRYIGDLDWFLRQAMSEGR